MNEPKAIFEMSRLLPLFFTNRLTKEREVVFCTSKSADKSKAMTGSMKASGKGEVTVVHKWKGRIKRQQMLWLEISESIWSEMTGGDVS